MAKKHPVFDKFAFDKATNSSKCNDCNIVMMNNHPENLMRHLKRKHVASYDIIDFKRRNLNKKARNENSLTHSRFSMENFVSVKRIQRRINISITANEIKEACVEMVTINGRPLSILEDSGFRRILNPILNGFDDKITINKHNIRDDIIYKAKIIRLEIAENLKNKMFSLKIDSASRLDRSILGINVQFIEQKKYKLKL